MTCVAGVEAAIVPPVRARLLAVVERRDAVPERNNERENWL